MTASMNTFAAVHAAYVGADLVDSAAAATHAVLSPAHLVWLLGGDPPAGLEVVVAGDSLARPVCERAADTGMRVHHYYGAAELSFVAWGTHRDDLLPFPGVDVTVRDRCGRRCGGGQRCRDQSRFPRKFKGKASGGTHACPHR